MAQRGWPRVSLLALAVLPALWAVLNECALADTFTVTKTLDTRDGKCDSDCSLREAVIAANQHAGPDTIVAPAGTYVLQQVGQEDNAAAGDLDILDDLTIQGAGAANTMIDGNHTDRVFQVFSPALVHLSRLTIQNGGAGEGGGLLNSGGTLTLDNCTLSDNSATSGGAITNQVAATLTLDNCTLSGNSAASGGALSNQGTVTLTNSTLSGNSAARGGGAITNQVAATLTLNNCTLNGNSTPSGGGGALSNQGTVTLTKSTLSSNSALQDGGAISNQVAATLTLDNCTLNGNSTQGPGYDGGAISNQGTVTLNDCTLSSNSATRGGGIDNERSGSLMLDNCTLSGNSAEFGGGIYVFQGITMLTACTLTGNSATYGGGIFSQGAVTLDDCTLSGNSATYGGGIDNHDTLTLTNSTLSGNSASSGDGGGIANGSEFFFGSGSATLTNCTLSGNSATRGGGIANGEGTVTLTSTIIANSPQGRSCYGTPHSNGYNLDDDGGCGFFNTGDLSIVSANLTPLCDYGGSTRTHALCIGPGAPRPDCQAASPAIDAGDNAHCPSADQRGAPRPYGAACDIGAYESGAQPPAGLTSSVLVDPCGAPSCTGDCDQKGTVTVDEILTMVNIALTNGLTAPCVAGDANHDVKITVDEILTAVNNALGECLP